MTLLGIDLGTRSVKAVLLDRRGETIGAASAGYGVAMPHPGWAESDPAAWWGAVRVAVAAAARGHDIAAIGVAGQMHGVVLVGPDRAPIRPAVIWADTRAAAELAEYEARPAGHLARLGNPLTVGMAGPTLLWLRRNEPEHYAAAVAALSPKDWLRLRLAGDLATDPSDASASLLYDIAADAWHEDLIAGLGLRREILPRIRPSAEVVGGLTAEAAASLGLAEGTPVAVGGADAAASLVGSGLGAPGDVEVVIGTGMQVVAPRAAAVADPTARTHLFRDCADGWYAMAAMQSGGMALEWVREILGLSWDQLHDLAFAAAPGAGGVTFVPYLTGERTPVLDPTATGAWTGLRAHHGRAELARAALEGVAFSLRRGMDALEDAGVPITIATLVGGGSVEPRWRQLLADATGRPLAVASIADATARGAALIAGWGTGRLPPVSKARTEDRVTRPRPSAPLAAAFARFEHVASARSQEER